MREHIFPYFIKVPKILNSVIKITRMEGFQNKFSRPIFTIIFRPKMIFLVTDSILRVKTMVVSQPYSVLTRLKMNKNPVNLQCIMRCGNVEWFNGLPVKYQ